MFKSCLNKFRQPQSAVLQGLSPLQMAATKLNARFESVDLQDFTTTRCSSRGLGCPKTQVQCSKPFLWECTQALRLVGPRQLGFEEWQWCVSAGASHAQRALVMR